MGISLWGTTQVLEKGILQENEREYLDNDNLSRIQAPNSNYRRVHDIGKYGFILMTLFYFS